MPTSSTPPPTKSGITTSSDGASFIPSSTRPDGSTRREIKVRPGYRPPEDVEVYKNRTAEAWKSRGKGGIPGAEGLDDDEGGVEIGGKAGNKNAKRREARKKAKVAAASTGDEEGNDEDRAVINGSMSASATVGKGSKAADKESWRAEAPEPVDGEVEKEKKAKRLQKKLRQARELREKKDQGETLLPEQFEKVIKIQELIRELGMLGFDAEGIKKEKLEGGE